MVIFPMNKRKNIFKKNKGKKIVNDFAIVMISFFPSLYSVRQNEFSVRIILKLNFLNKK